MKLHFLKTKWSDMIVLESDGRIALVDTGIKEQYDYLDKYLRKLGASRIDFILLTHFHRDHYDNISEIVKNFDVEKVYMKEYSGLDAFTAWGTPADDAYRQSEIEKYGKITDAVTDNSRLIRVEELSSIPFGEYELKLFSVKNSIREIYEDEAYPETYHKILFSENQNSLGIFLEADGKNIFLGGDIMDKPSTHPMANYVCSQVAKLIGKPIDIYKAPHHGTIDTACDEALEIFRPKTAIITNEDAYLSENSDVYENLRRANPTCEILLTDPGDVVIDTRHF